MLLPSGEKVVSVAKPSFRSCCPPGSVIRVAVAIFFATSSSAKSEPLPSPLALIDEPPIVMPSLEPSREIAWQPTHAQPPLSGGA